VYNQLKAPTPSRVVSSGHTETRVIDRSRNAVVSGIAENRDDTVWRTMVVDVIRTADGRDVQIIDAFRVGGRFDSSKTRPILIKLQSVWDRRIVLNGARRLANVNSLRRVFLSPDEPVDVRRRNTIERLKHKALRDGKCATVNDGVLLIDGIAVFSIVNGFVRQPNDDAAAGARADSDMSIAINNGGTN
jgi:hypothetical protein